MYKTSSLNLIVIDEFHLACEWGRDFRKQYLNVISDLRDAFPTVPVLCLSATVTERIRQDAESAIRLRDYSYIAGTIVRQNLRLTVRSVPNDKQKYYKLGVFVRQQLQAGRAGIVYTPYKDCKWQGAVKGVEAIKTYLELYLPHGTVATYVGGIGPKLGRAVLENFQEGKIKVVVATKAFGLGIDNHRVGFVCHASPPTSVEQYYQEIGRCGRSGAVADCLCLYTEKDFSRSRTVTGGGCVRIFATP